jgi:excisionase family DNA binding protein
MDNEIRNAFNEIKKELQENKVIALLNAKKALTMNDAALLTGHSKSHLYKLVHLKRIPYYKSKGGKITYFDKEELTKWMLNLRVKTAEELETEAANYLVTGKHSKEKGHV